MNAIERYLLFVISLAVMITSDDSFDDKENQKSFLDHIFNLHNTTRSINNLTPLKRNTSMDTKAKQIIRGRIFENKYDVPEEYAVNWYLGKYDNNTKLDIVVAGIVFEEWNAARDSINDETPDYKKDASRQIVWTHTTDIGLAVDRNDEYYAVLVLYTPRYISIFEPNASDVQELIRTWISMNYHKKSTF